MTKYNIECIINLYKRNNYVLFTGPFNLNIFGIRSSERRIDRFDDWLGVLYENDKKEPKLFICKGTVDPGLPWLINPMEQKMGTAAVYPGQYRRVWKLGTFRRTPALLQVAPIKCYRDNNRDNVFNYDPATTSTGVYGIHFHEHFQRKNVAELVNNSSAGCIVPQTLDDFYFIINLCFRQKQRLRDDHFTFTLFEE